MLFLPRSVNESIMIGDHIEIKVARIDEFGVCLGIDAPREMSINRKEFYKKIKSISRKGQVAQKITEY